jgi:uncharacterized protein
MPVRIPFIWRSCVDKSDNGAAKTKLGDALDPETLEFVQQVFLSVRVGNAEKIGTLLDMGLPPNLRNQRGDSLLMLASYHGHLDVARLLLEHGADPEIRNDLGQSPIAGAAYKGDLAMVTLLLDFGADVEGASPDGKTALMMAAMFNRTAIVDLLVSRGANITARDASGVSIVDAAKITGAVDTAAQVSRMLH